jgi:hypothetical protein
MVGSYEEFASIKRATLKRETLADADDVLINGRRYWARP